MDNESLQEETSELAALLVQAEAKLSRKNTIWWNAYSYNEWAAMCAMYVTQHNNTLLSNEIFYRVSFIRPFETCNLYMLAFLQHDLR